MGAERDRFFLWYMVISKCSTTQGRKFSLFCDMTHKWNNLISYKLTYQLSYVLLTWRRKRDLIHSTLIESKTDNLPSHRQSCSSVGSISSLDLLSADSFLTDTSLIRNWTWSDLSISSLLFFRSLRHFSFELLSSSVLRNGRLFGLSVEKSFSYWWFLDTYNYIIVVLVWVVWTSFSMEFHLISDI